MASLRSTATWLETLAIARTDLLEAERLATRLGRTQESVRRHRRAVLLITAGPLALATALVTLLTLVVAI